MTWPVEDPFAGKGFLLVNEPTKRVWLCIDEQTGKFQQCTEERVDPLLDENKERFNDSEGMRWGDGRRVASIPLAWWWRNMKPAQEQGDQKYLKKKLNDGDFSKFRTFKGNV